MTTLRPADAEAVIVDALAEVLGEDAVSTVALQRDRMVVVDLGAGSRTALALDVWPVALQAYARSDPDAARLCSDALVALCGQAGYEHATGAFIVSVQNPGLPAKFPDPDAREPRYQVTADVMITPPDQ